MAILTVALLEARVLDAGAFIGMPCPPLSPDSADMQASLGFCVCFAFYLECPSAPLETQFLMSLLCLLAALVRPAFPPASDSHSDPSLHQNPPGRGPGWSQPGLSHRAAGLMPQSQGPMGRLLPPELPGALTGREVAKNRLCGLWLAGVPGFSDRVPAVPGVGAER